MFYYNKIILITAFNALMLNYHSLLESASFHRYSVELEEGIKTKSVFMGNGDIIEMNDTNYNKKSLFSFGFGGCTGVVLYVLLKNHEQRAALTHYPPINTSEHIVKIKKLVHMLKQNVQHDEIEKIIGIIFHPCKYAIDEKTGCYSKKISYDSKTVDQLKTAILKEINYKNVCIIQELYSMVPNFNEYHPGGMFGNKVVPKELEIVLCQNPAESYVHSKATYHLEQLLSKL